MKSGGKELDVDFIGGMGPLTKEEEKAISDFIKAQKARRQKAAVKRMAKAKPIRLKAQSGAIKAK